MSYDNPIVFVDVDATPAENKIADLRREMGTLCQQIVRVADAVSELGRELRDLPIEVAPKPPKPAKPVCPHGCQSFIACKGDCDPFAEE